MIVIDASVLLLISLLVLGIMVGRILALVALIYGVDDWVMDRISNLVSMFRRTPRTNLRLDPEGERKFAEMAKVATSLGLSRAEVMEFSRNLGELSKKVGL